MDVRGKKQPLPGPCIGYSVQRIREIFSHPHFFVMGLEKQTLMVFMLDCGIVQAWRSCAGEIK